MRRSDIETGLAKHYSEKFKGDVRCQYDDQKRAYCIQGSNLPSHPDLRAQYPNGWELLDFIKPSRAREILSNGPGKELYAAFTKERHANETYAEWLEKIIVDQRLQIKDLVHNALIPAETFIEEELSNRQNSGLDDNDPYLVGPQKTLKAIQSALETIR